MNFLYFFNAAILLFLLVSFMAIVLFTILTIFFVPRFTRDILQFNQPEKALDVVKEEICNARKRYYGVFGETAAKVLAQSQGLIADAIHRDVKVSIVFTTRPLAPDIIKTIRCEHLKEEFKKLGELLDKDPERQRFDIRILPEDISINHFRLVDDEYLCIERIHPPGKMKRVYEVYRHNSVIINQVLTKWHEIINASEPIKNSNELLKRYEPLFG